MTVAVVLSQVLRQNEAATYLRSYQSDRKLVITRYVDALDASVFPADIEVVSWAPSPKPPPSSRLTITVSRLKRWIRSGSGAGRHIERWARSAEWRLRYLDRVVAMLESRKASTWDLENPALVALLEAELAPSDDEIVVFDLFDLPAVLRYSREKSCRVTLP